jgi:hypothetical protein
VYDDSVGTFANSKAFARSLAVCVFECTFSLLIESMYFHIAIVEFVDLEVGLASCALQEFRSFLMCLSFYHILVFVASFTDVQRYFRCSLPLSDLLMAFHCLYRERCRCCCQLLSPCYVGSTVLFRC